MLPGPRGDTDAGSTLCPRHVIRLYTDASFVVKGSMCLIGLAATVRDDARLLSRVASAYTDRALTSDTSRSGETSKIAEMRACLLGFEHLASLRRQGWTWMIPRLDYFSDCCAVINALNKLRNRVPEGNSEATEILRLIRSTWETIGFHDLRLRIANERSTSDIRFCDSMSKYVRNAWVGGF